jgi:hypothetical protein
VLPETWTERLLAAGTVVGAAVLVGVSLVNWESFRTERHVDAASASVRSAPEPPSSPSARDRAPAPPPVTAAPEKPSVAPQPRPRPAAPAPAPATFVVRAVDGDSWLEVRRSTADGEELYYGTLAQGETATFDGLPLWVRTGALQNLELRLGDAPVEALPASDGGVAELLASPSGIRPAGDG